MNNDDYIGAPKPEIYIRKSDGLEQIDKYFNVPYPQGHYVKSVKHRVEAIKSLCVTVLSGKEFYELEKVLDTVEAMVLYSVARQYPPTEYATTKPE